MEIAIDNRQTIIPLKSNWETLVNTIVKTALKLEGVIPAEGFEVSISFVDDAEIKELNREYRQKDYATDVLSFPVDDISDYSDAQNDFLLGDIVISLETAARQAEEYGHSFERELGFLTAHGMLHLLGYDHVDSDDDAAEMRKKEEEIMEAVDLRR